MEAKSFYLMHKDIPITLVSFSGTGDVIECADEIINKEHAPIASLNQEIWFSTWWNERTIPTSRDNLHTMLKSKGYTLPKEYLHKNLGLSLTDCYWIKPMDSDLTWKDVNMFTNPFKDNSLQLSKNNNNSLEYSPNGSLKGNIEKTWIVKDNERFLVKGNRTIKSAESLTEVLASHIHDLQGHSHAQYKRIHIKDKKYDYGCITKIFTSEKCEMISAFELLQSTKHGGSYYKQLTDTCEDLGMDKDMIISDLDYLILTDYIMSQTDRHFNNIGFIRNPDTLEFIGMAPIYDSGNAMYFDSIAPKNESDLRYLTTKGFETSLEASLNLVKNPSIIDLTKLPPVSYIKDLYASDTKEDESHINDICYAYERRIDRCRNFQLGISPDKPVYFYIQDNNKDLVNTFVSDSTVNNLFNMCSKSYKYAAMQQEAELYDMAKESTEKAEKQLSKIIEIFESKYYTKDDVKAYGEIMKIPHIPFRRMYEKDFDVTKNHPNLNLDNPDEPHI